MRVSAAVVLTSTLVGCASLPKAIPELDVSAKRFEVPEGTARVYVYRLKSVFLGRYDSVISIDGEWLGDISKELYTFRDLSPGRHVISAVTLLVDGDGMTECGSGDLTVDTPNAGVYFVRVEVPVTWPVDPPKMELVDSREGMQAVLRCRLTGRAAAR